MSDIDSETKEEEEYSAHTYVIPLWLESLYSLSGILLGMAIISYISYRYDAQFLIPSFASSAVMLFFSYNNPLAQPRNILGGHLVAAIAGIITHYFWANSWWAITLAVVLAAFLMIVTKTLHPPGGATAIIAHFGIAGHGSFYILIPVVASSIIMILIAYGINNAVSTRKYPLFWW
ncbi:MAG: HPP family protein [Syntrophomonas sp.]|nr:HPP family protein [Syntrophomonas sp.]